MRTFYYLEPRRIVLWPGIELILESQDVTVTLTAIYPPIDDGIGRFIIHANGFNTQKAWLNLCAAVMNHA